MAPKMAPLAAKSTAVATIARRVDGVASPTGSAPAVTPVSWSPGGLVEVTPVTLIRARLPGSRAGGPRPPPVALFGYSTKGRREWTCTR